MPVSLCRITHYCGVAWRGVALPDLICAGQLAPFPKTSASISLTRSMIWAKPQRDLLCRVSNFRIKRDKFLFVDYRTIRNNLSA